MRFIDCYWPRLDRPTRIFAAGSARIEVQGRTPRNVWFPDDIVFLDYYPDALYPAELALKSAMPFRRGLINLTPPEATIWQTAYDEAVRNLPPTATIITTPRHTNFLRHLEEKSRRTVTLKEDAVDAGGNILHAGAQITKIEYDEFVAPLTPQESTDLVDGKIVEADLRSEKTFVSISKLNPDKSPVTLEQVRAALAIAKEVE